ncbi:MAG: DGQHR domain-containing protein [Gammaproteobacteria bacterium WSBS_2016_MAG_OTU1]
MTIFKKLAVKATQGEHTLFFTSFTVRDFFNENFYRVDKLDTHESAGMQRILNKPRAKKFGDDIGKADEEAFLPTSVFLATGKNIDYDEETQELSFDSSLSAGIFPLDVVDGQHRIEGLKMAVEEHKHLADFSIPAVIATNMSEPEKMLHFITVNIKQRPVDKGVSQHIISRFNKMLEVEKVPYLPEWLAKQVKGNDAKALEIVQRLNSDENSAWRGRVQLANENKKPRHSIKQASFVQSVKIYLFTSWHPLSEFSDEKRILILINFWAAVEKIFVDDTIDSVPLVVFKQSGLAFFHSIITPIINQLHKKKIYTTDAIEKCIMSAEPNLISTDAAILSPEYWKSGNSAGQQNRAGMQHLVMLFTEALAQANDGDIKL